MDQSGEYKCPTRMDEKKKTERKNARKVANSTKASCKSLV